jgi:uncharacterized damage-inducible protein DinB
MIDFIKGILTGQFEAGLCMLHQCIQLCPPAHWESKIANDTFRQVSYHTLFYVDCYLSHGEESFELRDLHRRGGNELTNTQASLGLDKDETANYALWCRRKAVETIAAETAESLEGESGFHWLKFSRTEAHLYNIRHIQHHTGQLSAFLRKVDCACDWVGKGWRTN